MSCIISFFCNRCFSYFKTAKNTNGEARGCCSCSYSWWVQTDFTTCAVFMDIRKKSKTRCDRSEIRWLFILWICIYTIHSNSKGAFTTQSISMQLSLCELITINAVGKAEFQCILTKVCILLPWHLSSHRICKEYTLKPMIPFSTNSIPIVMICFSFPLS